MTFLKENTKAIWLFTILICILVTLLGYNKSKIEFEVIKYREVIRSNDFMYSWIIPESKNDTIAQPAPPDGFRRILRRDAKLIDNRNQFRDTIIVKNIVKDTLTTWDIYNYFVEYNPRYKSLRDSEIPIRSDNRIIPWHLQTLDPRYRVAYKTTGINIVDGVPLINSTIICTILIAVVYFITRKREINYNNKQSNLLR